MREIESVEYPNRLVSLQEPDDERVDGEVQILSVTAADPEGFADPETSSIAVLSSGLTTIAIPVEADRRRRADPPARRLTCPDCSAIFRSWEPKPSRSRWSSTIRPSIRPNHGTACSSPRPSAPFPQSDHNKGIIEEALALYLSLLDYASENDVAKSPSPRGRKTNSRRSSPGSIRTGTEPRSSSPCGTRSCAPRSCGRQRAHMAPIHSPDGKNNIWFPSGSTERNPTCHLALLQDMDSRTATSTIGRRSLA